MKKAFTLIEVLLIIGTLPIIMLIMSRLFNTLLKESPRIWDNIQQNTTMLNMLSQLQSDIDKAQNLPEKYEEFISNDNLLLIEQEDTLVGYEFNEGEITRQILNNTQTDTEQQKQWKMPDAKIKWTVHKKDGNGYCLEITNYIESVNDGRTEKKMANSHLYFTGAM